MSDTAWVQLIGFLTLIVGGLLQYLNTKRQRQWDIEDRKLKAKELACLVKNEADKVATHTSVVAKQASEARQELADAIKENTEVSTQAFKEANNINNKLEQLGLDPNVLERERQRLDK